MINIARTIVDVRVKNVDTNIAGQNGATASYESGLSTRRLIVIIPRGPLYCQVRMKTPS